MKILSGLNPEQREAVIHFEGPLLILAGAGSGKTRVITHRMAYLIENSGVPPEGILAVTFTNKAAEEMRGRVARLLGEGKVPWIRTFHSTCARILRRWAHLLPGYDRSFTILDDQDSRELLATVMKELDGCGEQFGASLVASLIQRAKDELLAPGELHRHFAERLDDYLLDTVHSAYKRYQQALERGNSLDFADLIWLTVRLFQENLELLNLYRQRFRFILIDEYQDINYAQYIFAQLLSERYENICVVGDDDQAIYGWRGADPGWLLRFEQDFPRAKIVRLKLNYRSPGRVLRAAQALIRHNEVRKEKQLQSSKDDGLPLQIYAALDGADEASYIAMEINRLRKAEGVSLRDIALLYRVNTLSRALEEALMRQGIPYEVVRGVRFYERREVKDLISYLRLLVNPLDELSLLRVLNRPRRGLGRETVAAIKSRADREGQSLWEGLQAIAEEGSLGAARTARLQEFIRLVEELRATDLRPGELAEEVLERTGFLEALQGESGAEERLGNVDELLGQLREFETPGRIGEFLEGVALASDADSYSGEEGRVALMTLHVAKGLEFEVVFITGLEEGLLPHARVIQEGQVEEERRLIYVGMTRAKERLYLSYAAQRSLYGTLMQNAPSRFLAEIPPAEFDGVISNSSSKQVT